MLGRFDVLWISALTGALVALHVGTPAEADELTALPGSGKYFGFTVEWTKSQKTDPKAFAPLPLSRKPWTNGEAHTGTIRSAGDLRRFPATIDAVYPKLKVRMLTSSKLPQVDFDKKLIVFVVCERQPGQKVFQFDKTVVSEDGKRLVVHWTRDRHYYKGDKRAIRVRAAVARLPKGPRSIAIAPSASSGTGGPTPDLVGRALVLDRFDGQIEFEEWVYTIPVE